MANPRKFSEKIALHNQKQAEETAAFEAILREVSATTRVCRIFVPCVHGRKISTRLLGAPVTHRCGCSPLGPSPHYVMSDPVIPCVKFSNFPEGQQQIQWDAHREI